ncbi:Hypothetical predicted protein [Mytilus galloprovincialis]|uniref:Reverse transcriptase domain-containing protein n=1 Tax=Mytilus galloprovincialis TaxID=29158 RepID=A0A8B6D0K6_MYTGA|nr:Hypothetical predicted protein [Mytilus galloprovincialis]
MDALSGSHPNMDWEATDLVTAWKSFRQHPEFWFAGPLAKTAESQNCNYLMIWIGNKVDDQELNTDECTETINVNDVPVNFQQDTGLGCLPGTHKIRTCITKTVAPVVHASRKIPIAIKDKVKAELDRTEDISVIFKQQEPTQWVHSTVTVIKPNGKIRICIDPRDLNKAILREHYPLKTVEDVISQMPNAEVFSELDTISKLWHIQLDEHILKLCTFNTPFGRYRFARLTFPINSASKVFRKIVSEMVSDMEGAEAIIDDILIWGSDQKEHDMRLKQVLDRAREYKLKLSAGNAKSANRK